MFVRLRKLVGCEPLKRLLNRFLLLNIGCIVRLIKLLKGKSSFNYMRRYFREKIPDFLADYFIRKGN